MKNMNIFLAITGASGSIYGLRLIEQLSRRGCSLTVTASRGGQLVCRDETGLDLSGEPAQAEQRLISLVGGGGAIRVVSPDDLFCSAASGSAAPDAMLVAPCSMGSMARIACGTSSNLIERVADVMLKERRPLLMVPRETPFSEIHLENMLRLTRAGARIIPAMPAFYHKPRTVDDMVDFVAGKILDQLGIANELFARWGK